MNISYFVYDIINLNTITWNFSQLNGPVVTKSLPHLCDDVRGFKFSLFVLNSEVSTDAANALSM